jgi:DNA polymerase V
MNNLPLAKRKLCVILWNNKNDTSKKCAEIKNMPRGGSRKGAGRPKGTGMYGEPTRPVRVPASLIDEVAKFAEHNGYLLPLYTTHVPAGRARCALDNTFVGKADRPFPPDDSVDEHVRLNEWLIRHPESTYLVQVSGESMIKAGIHPGDILVVDSSLEAQHGQIVLASLDGDVTVKRLSSRGSKTELLAENDNFPPIDTGKYADFKICGVVVSSFRCY